MTINMNITEIIHSVVWGIVVLVVLTTIAVKVHDYNVKISTDFHECINFCKYTVSDNEEMSCLDNCLASVPMECKTEPVDDEDKGGGWWA